MKRQRNASPARSHRLRTASSETRLHFQKHQHRVETCMLRRTLNASRLQQEVDRRIHRRKEVAEDGVKIQVPRPQLQEADATGCN